MRFVLDDSQITCLPESPEEEVGVNDLGQPITLATHTLYFDIRPKKLPTPDHLALICFIVFYPYLAKATRIKWIQPVSPIWLEILKLHNLTTDINLQPQSSHPPSISQTLSSRLSPHLSQQIIPIVSPIVSPKIALSWGGGLDTWAAYQLHPNLYTVLVHERESTDPPIYGPATLTNSKFVVVTCNQKSISIKNSKPNNVNLQRTTQAGWATWVGVMVTSIWISADYGINMVATGGNIGSVFLNNGSRYHPTHLKPSIWYKTFELVGLPMYIPLGGLTDLGVIKILGSEQLNRIRYCWFPTKTGDNCHKCPKCIRKEMLLGREQIKLDNFVGPSYEYIRTNDPKLARWVHCYYGPALQLIPLTFDSQILIKALKNKSIEILPKSDEYLVEQYGYKF